MTQHAPDEDALFALVKQLYPLARSLTGDGVRETLACLSEVTPLTMHEVPTGTQVFDWQIPSEWTLRSAWIEGPDGQRVVDVSKHNLHLVGYSTPVHGEFSLAQLQPHLHSDPARPEVIPYLTSYHTPHWGFCLSHRQREALTEGRYRVCIETVLAPGSLTYGEVHLPGSTDQEFLLYTHTCHPSLANDNASGMAVCAFLARWLARAPRRLSYRVVFGPGTLGSLTWLSRNASVLPRIVGGLVLALVGDGGPLVYKRSWSGTSLIDRAAEAWLRREQPSAVCLDFSPWGYDERQFGSPGFRLPVGRLTRSPEEGYPEYHSSADNLDIIQPAALGGALEAAQSILSLIEANQTLINLQPMGEPQLGRRGLYRSLGGPASPALQRALLWVLTCGDGDHDLIHAYQRSGLPLATILEAEEALRSVGLLGPG